MKAHRRSDSATAALEDQRDQDITQLTQLMNVSVVQNPNNQISVFTGTGQQLVAGSQASQLNFDNAGTLSATALWSANPSQDGAGTITLVSPGGTTTDLIANNAIQSGQIGAYVQMRDSILPQAQNQLDELANQMSQALSNQTTSGTAVASGAQSGYSVDVGSLVAGQHGPAHLYRLQQYPAHDHDRVARPRRHAAAADSPSRSKQSGHRRQFFRRHGLGRVAAQRRVRDATCNSRIRPAPCLQVLNNTAAATSSIRCRRRRP